MGSQWNGMGKRLMDLPLFRQSIERSAKVLATKNVDLLNIVTTDDPSVFDNILHAFVGIAAIQVFHFFLPREFRSLTFLLDCFSRHSKRS